MISNVGMEKVKYTSNYTKFMARTMAEFATPFVRGAAAGPRAKTSALFRSSGVSCFVFCFVFYDFLLFFFLAFRCFLVFLCLMPSVDGSETRSSPFPASADRLSPTLSLFYHFETENLVPDACFYCLRTHLSYFSGNRHV